MKLLLIRSLATASIFGSIAFTVQACSTLAQWTAPRKVAMDVDPEGFEALEKRFWDSFHNGGYDKIGSLLNDFKALYVDYPNHPVIAARIGFLHIWRLAERRRLDPIPAEIISDATVCEKFFHEASKLDPSDARFKGFWASCILAEADIHHDERNLRKGYFLMKDSIRAWPEFNYFTAGYVLSGQEWDSKLFDEAVDWQWSNLDVCSGEQIDRDQPDYSPYMQQVELEGRKRACWNSQIAPHNFEGFFLNMGDMLVKQGRLEQARKIYATAKLSPSYLNWAFREVLEQRILEAENNVERFRRTLANQDLSSEPVMMFQSSYSCMACHQKR